MDITLIAQVAPRKLDAYNIRCLSSQLRKYGIQTRLVFLESREREASWNSWSYDSFLRHGPRTIDLLVDLCSDSKVVGFSVMTPHFNNLANISSKLKAKLDIPVIWGGIHPTLMPEESIEYADIVCLGEGENSLLELMTKLLNDEKYSEVGGMMFKSEGGLIKNDVQKLSDSLASFPPQDYDLEEKYLVFDNTAIKLDKTNISRYHDNYYATMISRGCVFKCTYCGNEALRSLSRGSRVFRKRSIKQVIEEIEWCKERYRFIDTVCFYDPNFLSLGLNDINNFAKLFKDRIRMPFTLVGFTVKQFKEEAFQALVESGLTSVILGIQTASDETRRLFDRRETNEEILKVSKFVEKVRERHALGIAYDIILDNPWEKEEDTIETLLFISSLPRPFYLDIFSLRFLPGTALFQKAVEEGIIVKGRQRDYYDQVYRGISHTYVNFLFMLVRDFPLGPSFVRFATHPRYRRIFSSIFDQLCYMGLWEFYLFYFKHINGYARMVFVGAILLKKCQFRSFLTGVKRKLGPSLLERVRIRIKNLVKEENVL